MPERVVIQADDGSFHEGALLDLYDSEPVDADVRPHFPGTWGVAARDVVTVQDDDGVLWTGRLVRPAPHPPEIWG